jgi:putative ABC transport system permease protein
VSASPAAPPAWLERRLARALGAHRWREAILGDLAEAFAARRRRGDGLAAFWYFGEAARLALRFAPQRLADGLARRLLLRPRRISRESAMSQLLFDLRLSLRALAKRPATTLLVVATLALGLGANVGVYDLVDAMIVRPFRFPASDRLVALYESTPNNEFERTNLSPASFLDYRTESAEVVEALVAFEWWNANLRGSEAPEKVGGFRTSSEFFDTLRVRPALGRGFRSADGEPGAPPVVVLGHDLWQRRFGGDPGVLGRPVDIDGVSHTVVGVAPPELTFPYGSELWAPLVLAGEVAQKRDVHYLGAFGRLVDGAELDGAAARFALVAERLAADHPEEMRDRAAATRTLAVAFRDVGAAPIFALFQASALFVLLIGWINVSNLVLARGQERQRELALLDALGAGRWRLVRLQVSETAVLAAAAALLALPVAALGAKLMRDTIPPSIAKYVVGLDRVGLDGRTVLATFGLAAVSLLAVAAWPALRASATGLGLLLRDSGRTATAGGRHQRGRNFLVVVEIGAALALVVAATLAVRASQSMSTGAQGYAPDGLLTFKSVLPEGRFDEPAERRRFAESALERLATLPGVESGALANVLPATGENTSRIVAIQGEPEPNPSTAPRVDLRTVTTGFFETLRLPLVAGRELDASDDAEAPRVAVISRSMAERYWPGRQALGQRFRAGDADQPWITVVGVAGDHVHHWFGRRLAPTYFVPYAQQPSYSISVALRTTGDPTALAADVRAAMAEVDPLQPIYELRTQRQQIAENTVGLRLVSGVMTVFAGLALLLAVTGVYGVMAYRVSLRRQEFGIRVALGASATDVLRLTLGQSMRLAAVGLGLGLAASVAVGRAVGAVLRGVVELDAGMAFAAAAALAAATFVAALVPARRALAADPVEVLRAE